MLNESLKILNTIPDGAGAQKILAHILPDLYEKKHNLTN